MRFCKACWYPVPWFVLSADSSSLWQIVCITAAARMLAGVIRRPQGWVLEFVFLMFSTKIVGAAEAGAASLLRCGQHYHWSRARCWPDRPQKKKGSRNARQVSYGT
ncbi:MAG: hypothetical protein ACLURV_12100 [Gallintestinimicrobium sp.]